MKPGSSQSRVGFDVQIADITNGTTCVAVWGPAARDILAPITDTDLTNDNFQVFLSQRNIRCWS
jgi:dimethylglycine oxidase